MEKTSFLDMNGRIINKASNARDGRKKVFFVKKKDPITGKFVKAYMRKAAKRRDGRNIANHKTVPHRIRSKRLLVNNSNKLVKNETTMEGLLRWHRHIFEHFGWMILAKAKGYGYKIGPYKRSISDFIRAAEKSHSQYKEDNRKRDTMILLKQGKLIRKYAKML